MTLKYSSRAAKKLVLDFVLSSIEQKKKSQYLQDIISIGKKNDVWMRILTEFFISNPRRDNNWQFSEN